MPLYLDLQQAETPMVSGSVQSEQHSFSAHPAEQRPQAFGGDAIGARGAVVGRGWLPAKSQGLSHPQHGACVFAPLSSVASSESPEQGGRR